MCVLHDTDAKDRRTKKLALFSNFAIELSFLSTCKRYSVGAITCDEDFTRIYSIGYNGPPKGLPNDGCLGDVGNCGCVHAEMNAISKGSGPVLISTVLPCVLCAGLIINCDVKTLYYLEPYRESTGLQRLEDAGINVQHIKDLVR